MKTTVKNILFSLIFVAMASVLISPSKAALCEDIEGYGDPADGGTVGCYSTAEFAPEGWVIHPQDASQAGGDITCLGGGLHCYVHPLRMCFPTNGVCRVGTQTACPEDFPIESDAYFCAWQEQCCIPAPPPIICTDTPYQQCFPDGSSCNGPEYAPGSGTCDNNWECCIHNCEGYDASYHCDSDPCTPGTEVYRPDRYCSSGSCCQTVSASHTCQEIGGNCQSACNGTQQADTSATGCSGSTSTCCAPVYTCNAVSGTCGDVCEPTTSHPYDNGYAQCDPENCCIPNTTCGGICVASTSACPGTTEEFTQANSDCPSGTKCCEPPYDPPQGTCPDAPDGACIPIDEVCQSLGPDWVPSILDTCEQGLDHRCCVQAQACIPNQLPSDQCSISICPFCGTGGCPVNTRCTNMGTLGADNWRCIPMPAGGCTINIGGCENIGECGDAANTCPQGQMCMANITIGNYCMCDPACGIDCDTGTLIPELPYTGPITTFTDLIKRFYFLLFGVGVVLGVLFIIKAGYTIMTSEGNPDKIKEGQEDLTASILGLVFVILAVAILRLIIQPLFGSM